MDTDLIRQFSVFANLPAAELNLLAESLRECTFQPGERILNEGCLSEHFYLVLDGEVEIVKSLGTPDERLLALSEKGAVLGEMSMFSRSGAHTASARAHTPVRLLKITFDQFDAVLHRHPRLAYDLLRLYSSRLEHSESQTIRDLREKNRQLTQAYQELQAAQAAQIEKEKLEHELSIAAEIQRSILPEERPGSPGFDFGALMIPARQVGGDFYDFIPLDDHRIGIVVGDVCDKGVPAALFMALTYSSTRSEALRSESPGETVRAVNRHLLQVNRSGMFVTLLYGILDCTTGQFSYARAGHPAPLVFDALAQPVPVPLGLGQPVGLFDELALDEQTLLLPPGGTLLIFSDGLSETVEALPAGPALPQWCETILKSIPHGTHPDLIQKETQAAGLAPARRAQAFCDGLWHALSTSAKVSPILDDFTVVGIQNDRSE